MVDLSHVSNVRRSLSDPLKKAFNVNIRHWQNLFWSTRKPIEFGAAMKLKMEQKYRIKNLIFLTLVSMWFYIIISLLQFGKKTIEFNN